MTTEKQYRLMDSAVEARAAIGDVIASATRELCVFDVTPSMLREREFAQGPRIEALHALLRGSQQHRLRMVLREVRSIELELPRLLDLLRRFGGQVAIHRAVGDARNVEDVMIIADAHSLWRKPVASHPRSIFEGNNTDAVTPWLERFEEIWESSELAVSGETLGL